MTASNQIQLSNQPTARCNWRFLWSRVPLGLLRRQVRRNRKHYNLDGIISVGYRVNSMRATQFRICATEILKQYLVEGYTLNQARLHERGIEFEQALDLLSKTLANQHLLGKAVERLINDNTLVTLALALALLVAESKPEQKEMMIRLTQQFILLKE